MNQIQFIGKRKDNHEWACGYVIKEPSGRTFIGTYMPGGLWDWVEVEADTVGACVGISDKNGVNVFEGDLMKVDDRIVRVYWNDRIAGFDCEFVRYLDRPADYFASLKPYDYQYRAEVIGNRWDNPELMGKD